MRPALDSGVRRTALRIGIQTAVLVIVCLAAVGALVYGTVLGSQDRQITQVLSSAAASAGSTGDPDRDGGQERPGRRDGSVHLAVLRDGRVSSLTPMPPGLPEEAVMAAVARTGTPDRRSVALRTGRYDVLTVRRDSGVVVQAAVSQLEQHQERERILTALGLGGAVGVVLSALLGALLAQRAVQPMAAALSLQRRFVADAGHELRTPLTLLSTRAQLLRRRIRAAPGSGVEDASLRDIDGIVADTRALTDILEELLLAADTRTPVPQEPVDLGAVVTAAVAAAQAAAEARQITLTLETSTASTLAAGAPAALTRAVTALIDNALGHAEQDVRVTLAQRGSQLAIDVADDGPGIADATLPRLFDRFSSDRDQTSDPVRHYGLGLALVSEIAVRHGGTVNATNRRPPDRGAVLTLLLPR